MDPRVEIILEVIRKDLAQVPTAAKLSELVNISTSRFYELFKAEMRTSPARYRKTINMEAAKVLSETTLLSVKEIAVKTGFNDLSHFVRDFKKHYGVTPTEYRKRNYAFNLQVQSDAGASRRIGQ